MSACQRRGRRPRAAAPDPRPRRLEQRLGPGRAAALAEREVFALDMPGFGAAPPLPPGIEPTAATSPAALHEQLRRRAASSARTSPATASAPGSALEMGRAGCGRLGHLPLPRRALAQAARSAQRVDPRAGRGACARSSRWRCASRPCAGALATFAAHPEPDPARRRPRAGPRLDRRRRLRRRQPGDAQHIFEPDGYPADVPVTIAWGELDRLVGPPRPERRPAGARFLVLPDVGHTPMWDDPELVARTLLEGSDPLAGAKGSSLRERPPPARAEKELD